MSAVRLPREHHVGLHCSPKSFSIEKDPEGRPVGINTSAFRVDADGLSVNWLEFQGETLEAQHAFISEAFKNTRDIKKSHRLGLMNIGDIEETGSDIKPIHVEQASVIFVVPPNLGHSLVKGLDPTDEEVLHDLTVIVELHEFSTQSPPLDQWLAPFLP